MGKIIALVIFIITATVSILNWINLATGTGHWYIDLIFGLLFGWFAWMSLVGTFLFKIYKKITEDW